MALLILTGCTLIAINLSNPQTQDIILRRKNHIEGNIKDDSEENTLDPIENVSENMFAIKSAERTSIKSTILLQVKDKIGKISSNTFIINLKLVSDSKFDAYPIFCLIGLNSSRQVDTTIGTIKESTHFLINCKT